MKILIPGLIENGDIVVITEEVIDNNIVTKQWSERFFKRLKYYKVKSISNNGDITAVDFTGKIHYHIDAKKVERAYRTA